MAHHTTNPTGYATAPDLGPLFAKGSAERNGVGSVLSERPEGCCAQNTPDPLALNSLPTPSSLSSAALPKAVDVSARAAEGRMQRILRYLTKVTDATLDEICAAFSDPQSNIVVSQNQISGRISDLKRDLYIRWTGQTRPSRSGCSCDVYEITDAGRAELVRLRTHMTRGHGDKETRR